MTKNNKELIRPHVNVGTIGHIDHGLSSIMTLLAHHSNAVAVVTTGDIIDSALWTPETQGKWQDLNYIHNGKQSLIIRGIMIHFYMCSQRLRK